MGSICSCFLAEDPAENSSRNSNVKGFIHTIFIKYATVFNTGDTSVLPEANTGLHAMNSNGQSPLPRLSSLPLLPSPPRLQVQLPRANSESQLQNNIQQITNGFDIVRSSDYNNSSKSPHPIRESKLEAEITYLYASQDDEDVCPTCLEDYSFDNPRIVTHCQHHFHLGCIYEWMERSQSCPLCFKEMVFDEAT
ncbi:E3 ubiquitin-protein ligase At3g02290 [Jatropha curcas]|uniref:E3 ubiquitin-protein ligase At3g02290 n=1 Tax=Jatropha curcas TaxID=180498 RepID=UPI0009D6B165|nr:E3 ubiquitin-protein ligase At3g02290 [Jatropha curcas]